VKSGALAEILPENRQKYQEKREKPYQIDRRISFVGPSQECSGCSIKPFNDE
jgi:hypothetical protein